MTGFAWVGMGLFWLVLIGVIVWLASRLWSTRPQAPTTLPPAPPAVPMDTARTPAGTGADPALEILDRRLATGEIDVETYRAIRATILETRGGAR